MENLSYDNVKEILDEIIGDYYITDISDENSKDSKLIEDNDNIYYGYRIFSENGDLICTLFLVSTKFQFIGEEKIYQLNIMYSNSNTSLDLLIHDIRIRDDYAETYILDIVKKDLPFLLEKKPFRTLTQALYGS